MHQECRLHLKLAACIKSLHIIQARAWQLKSKQKKRKAPAVLYSLRANHWI